MAKTYSEKLRDPRWQKLRLEVMQRDGWRCLRCQSTTNELNVHHLHYERGRAPWEYPPASLETICDPCHAAEHGKGERALPPPPKPISERLRKRLHRALDGNSIAAERAALRQIQREIRHRQGVG